MWKAKRINEKTLICIQHGINYNVAINIHILQHVLYEILHSKYMKVIITCSVSNNELQKRVIKDLIIKY